MNSFPRWLIVLLALTGLILLVGGAWFLLRQEHDLRMSAEANLEAAADLKVEQLAEWRFEQLREASVLMESTFFRDAVERWLAAPDADLAEKIITRFRGLQRLFQYQDVMLVAPSGLIKISLRDRSGQLHAGAMHDLVAAFQEKKPVMTELHISPPDAHHHLDVVAPLFSGPHTAGEPLGAIVVTIDARQFIQPLVRSWPTPSPSSETLLVRRDGDSVLFLTELRHLKDTALKVRIPLTNKEVPAVMAVTGTKGIVKGKDYRGVDVISALKPVPDSPWFLVAKVDEDEALATWRSRAFLASAFVVGLLALMLAAVGLAWQHNRRIYYKRLFLAEKALREVEEGYRITLMSVGDGIISTDARGRVELLNPVAEALTGWGSYEAHGRPLEEVFRIFNEQSHQPVENPVSRVLAEGLIQGLANHTVLASRDGVERPIADCAAPIRDAHGTITGVVLVFRDQSEERVAQKRLMEERERARQYLAVAGVMLLALDTDGRVTMINRKGCEILRYREDEIIGKNWFEHFLPLSKRDEVREVFARMIAEEVESDEWVENVIETRTGETRFISWHNSVVRNGNGSIVGTLSSGEDVTRRKLTERALESSRTNFTNIVEKNNDGILVLDDQSTVLYANAAASDLFQKGIDDLVGSNFGQPLVLGEKTEILLPLPEGDPRAVELSVSDVDWFGTSAQLVVLHDITDRLLVEKTLKASEERMRLLIEAAPIGIRIVQDGQTAYVNPTFLKIFGYGASEEVLGYTVEAFYELDDARIIGKHHLSVLSGRRTSEYAELKARKKTGEIFDISTWVTGIEFQGKPAVLAFIADITREKQLKTQLLQAQKMEAIGTLAGGIAHDFNNILTIISGFSELLLDDRSDADRDYDDIQKIFRASQSGAELVRQLLTFSRKVEPKLRPVKLNVLVTTVEKLLLRTIPKTIEMQLSLAENLEVIYADPSQIEQMLINLAVNAKHAMPDSGKLIFETRNIALSPEYARAHLGVEPGEYVLLTVSDTGHGMERNVLERIFEPFFSTKKPGEGTGLGLATVYGIVKGHRGHITCYSEPGAGTIFKIYLPVLDENLPVIEEPTQQSPVGGSEKLLLIDDETHVRILGDRLLSQAGYTVLTAINGREALEIYEEHGKEIDLVILDLIMPEMDGKHCLEELLKRNPDIKVVISSGYSSHGPVGEVMRLGARGFIQKPYMSKELLGTVRTVLDEG
jgi:PAS domain S-box-containing protein